MVGARCNVPLPTTPQSMAPHPSMATAYGPIPIVGARGNVPRPRGHNMNITAITATPVRLPIPYPLYPGEGAGARAFLWPSKSRAASRKTWPGRAPISWRSGVARARPGGGCVGQHLPDTMPTADSGKKSHARLVLPTVVGTLRPTGGSQDGAVGDASPPGPAQVAQDARGGGSMTLFDAELLVAMNVIEFELRAGGPVSWADFWLTPRRLRGSDFLMRWSQGRWSEDLLIGAVNMTERYFALPYGPSSAAPDDDVRAFELYFERLDRAGLGSLKRPDLLVFPSSERSSVEAAVGQVGGVGELPFTPEDASAIQALLARSVLAVECENSLWKCRQMPDFGADLRPQRRPDAPPPSPETPPTYRPFSVPGRRKPHPQHPEHAKPGRRSAAGARRGRVRSEPTAR